MARIIGLASVALALIVASAVMADEYFWDVAVPGGDSVFIEELTTGQVAAAIRNGTTTAIVPSGGLEQNGPYLATGKHNYAIRPIVEQVARKLGNALVTATVKFVPEGSFDPPSAHMRYPGSIGLRTEVYEAVLEDISRSLKLGGFTEIVLLGDSGGGQQESMAAVAARLTSAWKDDGVRVIHVPEYYEQDKNDHAFIAQELGIELGDPDKIHADYRYEALMALADPALVNASWRIDNGEFSVRGYDMGSVEEVLANARKMVEYRADLTVAAIKAHRQ